MDGVVAGGVCLGEGMTEEIEGLVSLRITSLNVSAQVDDSVL